MAFIGRRGGSSSCDKCFTVAHRSALNTNQKWANPSAQRGPAALHFIIHVPLTGWLAPAVHALPWTRQWPADQMPAEYRLVLVLLQQAAL
jgi:hypothetical protein